MCTEVRKLWNAFCAEAREFFAHKSEVGFVICALLLAYGFMLTHVSYNNDGGHGFCSVPWDWFYQGRWGRTLLSGIGLWDWMTIPFWQNALSLLAMFPCLLLFRVLIKGVLKESVPSSWSLTLSGTVFLTYPLHMELFIASHTLMIIIGFLLTFAALWFWWQQTWRSDLWATIVLFVAGGVYESYFFAFITGVLGLLFIKVLAKAAPEDWGLCVRSVVRGSVCTVIALVGFELTQVLLRTCHILGTGAGGAVKEIFWFSMPIKLAFIHLINRVAYDYFYNGLFYLPITIFVLLGLFAILIPLHRAVRGTRFLCCLLACLFFLSSLALVCAQGGATNYRSMQAIPVFIGLMALALVLKSRHPRVIGAVLIVLILFQTKEDTLFTVNDWRASEANVHRIEMMVAQIRAKYGYVPSKPVWIIGRRIFPSPRDFSLAYFNFLTDKLPRVHYTSSACAIAHFGEGPHFTALLKPLTGLEVNFTWAGTQRHQELEALVAVTHQPQWPLDGYIHEYDDCILVNLGPSLAECDENRLRIQRDFIDWWKNHLHRS